MTGEDKKMSAFSALSFQEQQEKWLSWRSQRLNYEPAEPLEAPCAQLPAPAARPALPIYSLPRNQTLDHLYQRHASAKKKTGAFTSTT